MQSRKVQASSVGQMTKHIVIVRNGQTGGDLTLDSNGDGTFDFVLPKGAIVTSAEVRGNLTNGSGTSVIDVGPISDPDGLIDGANVETVGGSSNMCWGSADTTGDGADKIRVTIDCASAAPTDGVLYVWLEYRFTGDIAWDQASLADPV